VADVPLVGRIAAGAPILAEESVEDVLLLPRRLVGHGSLFALRVVGDSMNEAAICDGDIVTVRLGLTWADTNGKPQASAVAYDRISGERRKAALEADGNTDVRLVPVAPGTLPQPQG
jgi:Peptidase S24-like